MGRTILAAMPVPSHPFLDWPGPIAFAHRGGASEEPENTMPAFQRAVDLGYTYLETDVHATTDGVLVAFHDPDLSRTTGTAGSISELTWNAVSAVRVDGREPIPRLDDLLGSFPHARVNIDCKSDAAVPGLAAAIRRTASIDRVCVGAFSDRRLLRLRSLLGDGLCSSYGPVQVAALRAFGLRVGGGQTAQVPVRQKGVPVVTEGFVERAHRRGLHVHVWTIDDPDEMRRLFDLGVDGIMTDRPTVLKEVLTARGAWHER
jgi:glycerophosphoryl diester phosphodiesterase